jgi:hypothetical protein
LRKKMLKEKNRTIPVKKARIAKTAIRAVTRMTAVLKTVPEMKKVKVTEKVTVPEMVKAKVTVTGLEMAAPVPEQALETAQAAILEALDLEPTATLAQGLDQVLIIKVNQKKLTRI